MSKEENTQQWTDEFDALVAAPAHHRLLFENEYVRVLDTLIPPGEMTPLHTHRFPASLYIISWSDFIRYDRHGNLMLDSRTLTAIPKPGMALWTGPLELHPLKNVGDKELHVHCVEIKRKSGLDEK